MQRTVEVCPYSVWMHSPVSAFHTLSVRSVEPLMMMLSLIWDDHTPPVCPTSVLKHCNTREERTLDDPRRDTKSHPESFQIDPPVIRQVGNGRFIRKDMLLKGQRPFKNAPRWRK